VSWRARAAFIALGSAVAFGYRGDWLAVAVAAVVALLPVAWRVRAELATTRARLRTLGEMSAVAEAQCRARRAGVRR